MADINLGILVLLGIGVLGGALGAWFFQRIRIPQVLGYILFGLIIGKSGLKLLETEQIEQLRSFTWFALGIIGFLVGGELKFDAFRQCGKQFFQILFWEGIFAFVLVSASSAWIIYAVTGNMAAGIAAGIVFGAIASATDPASTVEVLWEYRAKGILTTTIIAVIALDDALAMTLYGIGTSCAEMLIGGQSHLAEQMGRVAVELFGSVAFGLVGGGILTLFLKFIHQKKDRTLAISIGMMLVVIGLATAMGLDVILVTMAMGVVVTNVAPLHGEKLFSLVKSFSVPIYVMFFVMVGARLSISNMPLWLWGVVAAYVVGRTVGKMAGCWLGAKLSAAPETVRSYCGLGLFAQGGVAIGLSIMASQHLGDIPVSDTLSLGEVVIAGVTATTLIVQIIGPSMVKLSVRLAGEIGRNVTEEDVIASLTVGQAAIRKVEPLCETDSIGKALQRFSTSDNLAYPVINAGGKLTGLLTLSHMKDILVSTECWEWMVIADVMVSGVVSVSESKSLAEAMKQIEETGSEQVLVLGEKDHQFAGILDLRYARKIIQQELIRLQTQG